MRQTFPLFHSTGFARRPGRALAAVLLALVLPQLLAAADRESLRKFLEVTGFDVAIRSIQQGAMEGPALAGEAPSDFGRQYTELVREVFDPDQMVERALDMLETVLPDPLLTHAMAFYGSDLGQRIVEAENAAHMTPDEEKYRLGEDLVRQMLAEDPQRFDLIQRLNEAVGGIDTVVQSVIEIQVRYLMAAQAAGATDFSLSEDELRQTLEAQAGEIARNIAYYGVLGAAYTYRELSDATLEAYVRALETPQMQQVYEILNGVQFQIMAERYQALGAALGELQPQTEL